MEASISIAIEAAAPHFIMRYKKTTTATTNRSQSCSTTLEQIHFMFQLLLVSIIFNESKRKMISFSIPTLAICTV